MAKRKKLKISPKGPKAAPPAWLPKAIGYTVLTLAVIALGYFGYKKGVAALTQSKYFLVKSVTVDPSLSFIDQDELDDLLKGKSIFSIDMHALQRKLAYRYPEVTQLRIVKRFPNKILILAKKRLPFAQALVKNRTVVLDDNGIVLAFHAAEKDHLPLITGVASREALELGLPLRGEEILVGLKIIKDLQSRVALQQEGITKLDLGNLLNINVYLSNGLRVVMDKNDIGRKLDILEVLLAQNKVDAHRIKYIDLRFNEPIIGRK